MRELETRDRVARVIRAGTGEDYGDGYTVTDMAIGYAEPGYGTDTDVIVFGNWNPKRFPRGDEAPLLKTENLGPRLALAIEHAGGITEWLDEWTTCSDCYRAFRTSGDSYGWTMHGTFLESACEYVCADCMRTDIARYIDEGDYIDNPRTAITWCTKLELESLGWSRYAPGDPKEYESGWHEGQDDDPTRILAEIQREIPDASVVFHIDDVGQFDIRFSAFFRVEDDDAGADG